MNGLFATRCWIPSTEGARFGVKFKHADTVPQRSKFGLESRLYFDGVEVLGHSYRPSLVDEVPMYYTAQYTAEAKRYFQFGTLQLTGMCVRLLRKSCYTQLRLWTR